MNPLPSISGAFRMIKQKKRKRHGYISAIPDATPLPHVVQHCYIPIKVVITRLCNLNQMLFRRTLNYPQDKFDQLQQRTTRCKNDYWLEYIIVRVSLRKQEENLQDYQRIYDKKYKATSKKKKCGLIIQLSINNLHSSNK